MNSNIIHLEINGEYQAFTIPVIYKDIEQLKKVLTERIHILELMEECYLE